MKRILLYGSGAIVCAIAMLWIGANIIPLMPILLHFSQQQSRLLLLFRWCLIGALFFAWPVIIKRRQWALEKQRYWLAQRSILVFWLIVFELLLCENGLLFHGPY